MSASGSQLGRRKMAAGAAVGFGIWTAWPVRASGIVAPLGSDGLADAGVDCTSVRRSADAATGSVIVLAHAAERSFLNDRGANLAGGECQPRHRFREDADRGAGFKVVVDRRHAYSESDEEGEEA